MNDLKLFNYESKQLRTVIIDSQPWWVAKDVCDILELTNPSMCLQNLDADERSKLNLGRQGETNIVNESGLYSLVIQSRKPEAKKFKKWITSEVLPSIRKTGSYQYKEKDDLEIILLGYEKLMDKVKMLTPKAEVYDAFLSSDEAVDMSIAAKQIFGDTIGRNRLMKMLRELGILLINNTPRQEYMKYFKVIQVPKPVGGKIVNFPTTLVKPEGITYLAKKLKARTIQ